MSYTFPCGCPCNPGSGGGSISGGVTSSAVLKGRLYAPTYVSAYGIAVQHGFEGTEEEWLASLQGEPGKSAYEIAVEGGYTGTEEEWLASLVGVPGASAYEIACELGFVGTEEEWIASLKGQRGRAGKSAYRIACDNGFEGTQEEWLESLKGAPGKSAYEVAVENGYEGTQEDWVQLIANITKPIEHNTLEGRDDPDCHPIEAITALPDKFTDIDQTFGKTYQTISTMQVDIDKKQDTILTMSAQDILEICV